MPVTAKGGNSRQRPQRARERLVPPVIPARAILLGACLAAALLVVCYALYVVWLFFGADWQCASEINGYVVEHDCGKAPAGR